MTDKMHYEMTGEELLAELTRVQQTVSSAWQARLTDLDSIPLNEAFRQANAKGYEFMEMNAAWFIACMPIVAAVAKPDNWHIVRDAAGVVVEMTWVGDGNILKDAQRAFESHRYPPLKEEDYEGT